MRNLDKAESLKQRIAKDDLDIEILPLDVTDTASIQSAVDIITQKDGKIDILLNNAGAVGSFVVVCGDREVADIFISI